MPNRDPLVNKLKLINKPKAGDLKKYAAGGLFSGVFVVKWLFPS